MSLQTWSETIFSSVADATAVGTTGEQLAVPNITLPANYMYPGRVLRARLLGIISNIATTPGTITLRARWGGLSGTVLAASAALAQNTSAQTNDAIDLEFIITCRSNGSAGSMFTTGRVLQGNAVTIPSWFSIPANGNAVVGSLDTTIAQALSFTGQFSLTGNSWTVNQYTLEAMN
jgi:hypothetical protein